MRILFLLFVLFLSLGANAQSNVQAVDLGLPSGTLWADRNLGAKSEDGTGFYYCWGEVKPRKKDDCYWGNYSYSRTVSKTLNKYRPEGREITKYNIIDTLTLLEASDDAAASLLGSDWQMPTYGQMKELLWCCEWKWSQINNVSGYKIIGPNGNSIFIPATLERFTSTKVSNRSYPQLWLKEKATDDFTACALFKPNDQTSRLDFFSSREQAILRVERDSPLNVRAVKRTISSKQDIHSPTINIESIAEENGHSVVYAKVNSELYPCCFEIWINGDNYWKYDRFNCNDDKLYKTGNNEYKCQLTLKRNINTNDRITVQVQTYAGKSNDRHVGSDVNKSDKLPQLTMQSSATSLQTTYNLKVGVKSPSAISDHKVYLNGQLSRGANAIVNDGNDFVVSRTLTLQAGNNEIHVEITNASGTSSLTQTVIYTPKVNPTPQPTPQPKPAPSVTVNTQKRIALVIGNSKYTHATALPNPQNDATDISAKLRSLGFEVIEKHDLEKRAFKDIIREFGSKAQTYDAAVLYYAGHAIESEGVNYLIPIDADIKVQADVEDECVRAAYVIENLEQAKSKMNIIILDACRDNPIPRSWSRGGAKGLSYMSAPSGTFIAFSTAPGRTADDGVGRNSPFTEAFLKNLDEPNLQLEMFFKKVLQDVSNKTSNRQIPWTQSSFIGDFFFNLK